MKVVGDSTYLPTLSQYWRWKIDMSESGDIGLYVQERAKRYYVNRSGFYWEDASVAPFRVTTVSNIGPKTAEDIINTLREAAERSMEWGPWSPTVAQKFQTVCKALLPPSD